MKLPLVASIAALGSPLALVLAIAGTAHGSVVSGTAGPKPAVTSGDSVANAGGVNVTMSRDQLAARRKDEIARLHAYAQAGSFPRNFEGMNAPHMFRDADGRLCAVANLIHQDGHDEIVDEVVKNHNGLIVGQTDDSEVEDWIRTSGLTREEVERIQRPAPMIRHDAQAAVKPTPAPAPKPQPTVTAMTEAEMTAALKTQLAAIEQQLTDDTEYSLTTAEARLPGNH